MGQFNGFSPQALAFFKALGFHQNREWFHENKALYESEVKEPMLALLQDLTDRFEAKGIPLRGDKKSVFRINRDIRFSKDKRPYQTHTGAVMTPSGAKGDPGLIYIHITADGLGSWDGAPTGSFLAAGFHMPDNTVLTAFRNEIRKDPDRFQEMEAALKKAKLKLETSNQLKRLPRGFEDMKDSPVDGAIRLKNFIAEETLSEADVASKKLVTKVAKFAERSRPFLDWGWDALR